MSAFGLNIPDISFIEVFLPSAKGMSLLSCLRWYSAVGVLYAISYSLCKLNLGISPKGKMTAFAF